MLHVLKSPFLLIRSVSPPSVPPLARAVSMVPPDANPAVRALRPSLPPPLLLEFAVTREQAIQRFENHQNTTCKGFHARNLLSTPSATVSAAMLPFWQFDATIKVECRASLGYPSDRQDPNSEKVWKDMDDWKTLTHHTRIQDSEPYMQVYASYILRRDLVEGAKVGATLHGARPMTTAEAEQLILHATAGSVGCSSSSSVGSGASGATDDSSGNPGSGIAIQAPHMRQSIAWQLAYRALMHQQTEAAERMLKADSGAADVRDVKINMAVLFRTARLVYLPAYIADYQFGEKHTPGKDVVPEVFQALIGAAEGSGVVAEAHFSPVKAQVTTASTVGAAVAATSVVPMLGMDPFGMGGVDAVFWAFLSASAAGMLVRRMPQSKRNQHMVGQMKAELEFYRRYDAYQTGLPSELSDEHTMWLWLDADWRKWENEDPWHWKEGPRREWAEELFKSQARRAKQRSDFKHRLLLQQKQLHEDLEREAKKEARFGERDGPHVGGSFEGEQQQWGAAGATPHHRRRKARDFLGYYKLLGLDNAEEISGESIKLAFKKVAMQLHPDKLQGSDPAKLQRARDDFLKVQIAYEVLKDADRRRLYDRGQLVQ